MVDLNSDVEAWCFAVVSQHSVVHFPHSSLSQAQARAEALTWRLLPFSYTLDCGCAIHLGVGKRPVAMPMQGRLQNLRANLYAQFVVLRDMRVID